MSCSTVALSFGHHEDREELDVHNRQKRAHRMSLLLVAPKRKKKLAHPEYLLLFAAKLRSFAGQNAGSKPANYQNVHVCAFLWQEGYVCVSYLILVCLSRLPFSCRFNLFSSLSGVLSSFRLSSPQTVLNSVCTWQESLHFFLYTIRHCSIA